MLELQEVQVARDLVIQPRHVRHVILHPEPQLCVPGSVDAVLLQLLAKGLVPQDPAKVFRLRLVLETKV